MSADTNVLRNPSNGSATNPQREDFEARELIEEALPEKSSFFRRIHFLWQDKDGRHYRVNSHDPSEDNSVVRSAFVVVSGGKAKVIPEVRKERAPCGSAT